MRVRALAVLAIVAVSGCGSVLAPPDGTGGGNDTGGGNLADAPAEVRRGAELFAANCQVCHGADAAGGSMYGASLQGHTGIAGRVRSGGGGMPAFSASSLADGDVAAIEAWLAWLAEPGNGGGGGGGNLAPFEANCAVCHGAGGEGTDRAPQIRSPNEGYATWVVRNGRSTMGYAQPMPAFSAAQLSADELDEIFTFLHEQPLPGDGEGLYLRFCGNCHGPQGRGGVVGVNVRDELDELQEIVREGHAGTNYGARRSYMPAFGRSELPDGDLAKIAAYLGSRAAGGGFGDDDDDRDHEDGRGRDHPEDDFGGCATAGGLDAQGLFAAVAVLAAAARRRRAG